MQRIVFANGRVVLVSSDGERCSMIARAEFRGVVHRHEALVYLDEGVYKVLVQTIEEGVNFMETPKMIVRPSLIAALRVALKIVVSAQKSAHDVSVGE